MPLVCSDPVGLDQSVKLEVVIANTYIEGTSPHKS